MTTYHTLSGKLNRKDGKHRHHREYSVELGLRTHRPSAITSSFEPCTHAQTRLESSLIQGSIGKENIHRDTLSQCSTKPLHGDSHQWWELPVCSTNGNYQQKTKNVRISYSADEIYGKANLNPSRKVETAKKLHDLKSSKVSLQSSETIPSSLIAKHDHSCLLREADSTVCAKLANSPCERDSETGEYYPTKATGLSLHCQTKTLYDDYGGAIKYRTFEEAMKCYPSDESDDSDISPDSTPHNCFQNSDYFKNLLNGKSAYFDATNVPHTEFLSNRKTLPTVPTFANVENSDAKLNGELLQKPAASKSNVHVHKEAWIVENESQVIQPNTQDSTPAVGQLKFTDVFADLHSLENANMQTSLLKETPADSRERCRSMNESQVETPVNLKDINENTSACIPQPASTELPQTNQDQLSNLSLQDSPVMSDLHVSQDPGKSTEEYPHKNDHPVAESPPVSHEDDYVYLSRTSAADIGEGKGREEPTKDSCGKVASPDREPVNTQVPDTFEVPPIDLSQLSPRKTKSPKPSQKSLSKSNVSTTKSSTQTDFRKARPSSAFTPKAGDFKDRKRIAREIKLRVQKNPTEIAGEIKRRVQRKEREEPKSEASKSTDYLKVELKPYVSKSSNYLRVDPMPPATPSIFSLNSFRSYDRYNEMSPRIQSGEISRWQCLPEEIWLMVLSFLSRADLHSFMLTCSDFNRLSHDRSLWRDVTLSKKQLSDEEVIKLGFLRPSSLSIIQCTGIKLNGDTVSNKGLRELFSSCGSDLKQLSAASCVLPPLSGEAMLHHAAVHCNNIQSLDISWCNLTNRDLELVTDSFTHLRCLSTNGNQSITDTALTKLCRKFAPQLEKLELQGCFKLTNHSLAEIGCCVNLQLLNIGQCHKFSSSRIASEVSRLTNLETCNMKGLKQLKDGCVTAIVNSCSKIQQLVLAQCTALSPKSLIEVSCSLSSLSILDVSSCKDCVNDATINAMLANCTLLTSLDLSSTPVSNQSVAAIAASCKYLKELKLNFCSVTEGVVMELLLQSLGLRKLSLYGVKGVQLDELSSINSMVIVDL